MMTKNTRHLPSPRGKGDRPHIAVDEGYATPPLPSDNRPINCNLNSDQTSNPAYFSTSSEKMEFAQANHSRLKVYSSLASMLSCMK